MPTTSSESIYSRVTNRIIAALEQGTVPWSKPWVSLPHRNAVTGRPYRGINILQLELTALERGYRSTSWLTFRQAKALGGHVKHGERGTLIVWYDRRQKYPESLAREELNKQEEWIYIAKTYWVFNSEQCEDIGARGEIQGRFDFEPLTKCQEVLNASGAVIRYGGNSAYYDPARDEIVLPHPSVFLNGERFYGVAWHELVHWTGHATRLARNLNGRFGDASYAAEECCAELGASFVSARCGIEHVSESASYIDSWLRAMRKDCRFLFTVARLAADAADYITPITADQAKEEELIEA